MSLSDPEDPPPLSRPFPLSGVHVLILDDDEGSASALAHAVTHLGGIPHVAHEVAEAKRVLVVMEPDVAVVDLLLLNGNGFATIREFKEHRPNLACVLHSGMPIPAGYEHDMPFLPKPFDLQLLADVILDAIGRMDTDPPKTERE